MINQVLGIQKNIAFRATEGKESSPLETQGTVARLQELHSSSPRGKKPAPAISEGVEDLRAKSGRKLDFRV